MTNESARTAVPTEISENIGKLNGDVEALQQELDQALKVWQATLSAEKSEFDELLKHKELAWQEQENQWASQSRAYESRLEELKTDFESRLRQSEQNAAHALAEIDDAWQREKLEWGPVARDAWPAQKKDLEAKLDAVEHERAAERQAYEAQLKEMENHTKSAGEPTAATVEALQGQLHQFQRTVASFQDRATRSDELVNACVQALDYQISVLFDLVQHYAPTGRPDGAPSDIVQP